MEVYQGIIPWTPYVATLSATLTLTDPREGNVPSMYMTHKRVANVAKKSLRRSIWSRMKKKGVILQKTPNLRNRQIIIGIFFKNRFFKK